MRGVTEHELRTPKAQAPRLFHWLAMTPIVVGGVIGLLLVPILLLLLLLGLFSR